MKAYTKKEKTTTRIFLFYGSFYYENILKKLWMNFSEICGSWVGFGWYNV